MACRLPHSVPLPRWPVDALARGGYGTPSFKIEGPMHDPLWIIMIALIVAFFFWQTRHS